jgi:thiol:disulfide interchange protein DsbC
MKRRLLNLISISICCATIFHLPLKAAEEFTHQIKSGDNLWDLSSTYASNKAELLAIRKAISELPNNWIYPRDVVKFIINDDGNATVEISRASPQPQPQVSNLVKQTPAIVEKNEPTKLVTNDTPKVVKKALDIEALKVKLSAKIGLKVDKILETSLENFVIVITDQGTFYASEDGSYLIQGKVYSLDDKVTDLAENSLAEFRLEGLEKFEDDMITYKAENEKYVVNVFTDITCGYCRKMHAEMADYNARGITFRYLAYPRSGIMDRTGNTSKGFNDLRSIWCNENSAEAMTKAKSGSNVAYRICETTIEDQFNFGRQIGVKGTPAMILPSGMMIPGYQPPAQLEELLKKS